MLQSFLSKIKDHRRPQGRRYTLEHILSFTILAVLSGATSYRKVHAFIKTHYDTLNQLFGLNWKRLPAYTSLREIIQGTSSAEVEACFRVYSADLAASQTPCRWVGFDGKVLRGSFDHFQDQKAIQVLSAFWAESRIILAHEEIAEKTNEIPTAQALFAQLGLSDCLFTFDALHCQEKTLETAHESGNEAVVQVKENQPTLLQDCQTIAQTQRPADVYQEPATGSRAARSRSSPSLTHADKWSLVEAVVKVDRHRLVFDTKTKCWQPSDETAFRRRRLHHGAEGSRVLYGYPRTLGHREQRSPCPGCDAGGRPVPHPNQSAHFRQAPQFCPQHPAGQSCRECELGTVQQWHEPEPCPELRRGQVELNSPGIPTASPKVDAVLGEVIRAPESLDQVITDDPASRLG